MSLIRSVFSFVVDHRRCCSSGMRSCDWGWLLVFWRRLLDAHSTIQLRFSGWVFPGYGPGGRIWPGFRTTGKAGDLSQIGPFPWLGWGGRSFWLCRSRGPLKPDLSGRFGGRSPFWLIWGHFYCICRTWSGGGPAPLCWCRWGGGSDGTGPGRRLRRTPFEASTLERQISQRGWRGMQILRSRGCGDLLDLRRRTS